MMLVDHSEPDDLVALLKQSVPVSIMPLNQSQRSDYYFGGEDSKSRQFGRVQAGELLANIDSMEDELRRYYSSADENNQIIEGIISSVPLTRRDRSLKAISIRKGSSPNRLFSYKVTEAGFIYDEHAWDISSSMLYAWLFSLAQVGVITYYTENYVGTARLLVAIYKNCQKPLEEHTTLNRYYIPLLDTGERDTKGRKIPIREQNPFIKALMALSQAYQLGIGEDRATKLSEHYKSLLDIAMAEVDELYQVDGIGRKTAEKLLAAIGREL